MESAPKERTHLDLSNDLLDIAKFAQTKMKECVAQDASKFFRSVCHNYYYSAYHLCLHLIPGLAAKTDKMTGGVHSMAHKKVAKFTKDDANLLESPQTSRIWSDYKTEIFPAGITIDPDITEANYRQFTDLIRLATSGDKKR
jgi:hypothetical protein